MGKNAQECPRHAFCGVRRLRVVTDVYDRRRDVARSDTISPMSSPQSPAISRDLPQSPAISRNAPRRAAAAPLPPLAQRPQRRIRSSDYMGGSWLKIFSARWLPPLGGGGVRA